MHRKLHVGTEFDIQISAMNMPTGGVTDRHLGNDFMVFPRRVYRLGRREADGARRVKTGPSTNESRSFVWLPYIPGLITLLPATGGHTIFTGRMSGCWLALCSIRGANYLAHIGTSATAQDEASLRVKRAFGDAVARGLIAVTRAFKPEARGALETIAAMSARRNFYTFRMESVTQQSSQIQAPASGGIEGGDARVSAPFAGITSGFRVLTKERHPGHARVTF